VRVRPYPLATIAGLRPGTAAVVILGDALTGHVSPLLFLVSVSIGLVGVALLAFEVRLYRLHHHNRRGAHNEGVNPALRS
jgi:uncharacterized membrane protein YdjX (TVP38/TMEM64 family)